MQRDLQAMDRVFQLEKERKQLGVMRGLLRKAFPEAEVRDIMRLARYFVVKSFNTYDTARGCPRQSLPTMDLRIEHRANLRNEYTVMTLLPGERSERARVVSKRVIDIPIYRCITCRFGSSRLALISFRSRWC